MFRRKLCHLLLLMVIVQIKIYSQAIDDTIVFKTLDANNIHLTLSNIGDIYSGNASWSLLQPQPQIVFDQSLWFVGKSNDSILLSLTQWNSTYSPGNISDGKYARIETKADSLKYRCYKIKQGDTRESNIDYRDWPTELGGLSYERKPIIHNDQTIWSVYNSLNPDTNIFRRWKYFKDGVYPIPIEIQQTSYSSAGNGSSIFENAVFFEYIVINKGETKIDSCYLGFWTDIDFDNILNNFPAIDTTLQLGYCWAGNPQPMYASGNSPAVGYQLLYGPIVEEANSNAVFMGRIRSGYKNLKLSSFHPIIETVISVPSSMRAILSRRGAWNVAQGLDADGNLRIDTVSGGVTKFPFSGDPVTNSGWIYPLSSTGGEAGFVFFTGPFNFSPNDTQWVMIALIPGLGSDRFESITKMKEKAEFLQSLNYDQIVNRKTSFADTIDLLPSKYSVSQNFPNPFNATTRIIFTIPDLDTLHTFDSWKTEISHKVTLKTYDILGREITTIFDDERTAGEYEVEFNAAHLASGVYFYRLRAGDYVETRKMILLR